MNFSTIDSVLDFTLYDFPQPECTNFILEDLVHKDYVNSLNKFKQCRLPCPSNRKGWACACSNNDKSTQTEDTETIEYLLGKLILKHCPQKDIVESYVKRNVTHINTSSKLLQLLTKDTLRGQLYQSVPSRSNEQPRCTTPPHEEAPMSQKLPSNTTTCQ